MSVTLDRRNFCLIHFELNNLKLRQLLDKFKSRDRHIVSHCISRIQMGTMIKSDTSLAKVHRYTDQMCTTGDLYQRKIQHFTWPEYQSKSMPQQKSHRIHLSIRKSLVADNLTLVGSHKRCYDTSHWDKELCRLDRTDSVIKLQSLQHNRQQLLTKDRISQILQSW